MPSDDGQKPVNSFFKRLSAAIFTHKKTARKKINNGMRLRSVGALRGILIPLGIIIAHDIFSKNSSIRKFLNRFISEKKS